MVEVRDLIKSIVKGGTTVFLSSHLLHEVQQICSHVTIINRGVSLASGTLKEVTNQLTGTLTLHVEVIELNDPTVDIIKRMPFVAEVQREGQHLTIELNTLDDVRHLISQTITQNGGLIVHMVQSGRELEDIFLKLISGLEVREQ